MAIAQSHIPTETLTSEVLERIERLMQVEEAKVAEQARRLALVGPEPAILMRDRNGVQVAMFGDDRPTPERVRHAGGVQYGTLVGKERVPAARVNDSTPLRKYLRDKAITETQFGAGLRLHGDFHRSGIEPRVTASYCEKVGGRGQGWDDLGAGQSDARRCYVAAMAFVHYRFRPVLVHVVCIGGTASGWAASTGKRGTTAQSVGMETLRYGLDDLAAWYELSKRR
ncbi:DUF6456 domain-containing protein [Ferrovibrio xuzhouensis]|uniref:DUF6456 domain-containing protein n=1 Tax=Ferrovibrio xuzhouensis TaxID=1576914 RepID=A0ABV7VC27_9PROT